MLRFPDLRCSLRSLSVKQCKFRWHEVTSGRGEREKEKVFIENEKVINKSIRMILAKEL